MRLLLARRRRNISPGLIYTFIASSIIIQSDVHKFLQNHARQSSIPEKLGSGNPGITNQSTSSVSSCCLTLRDRSGTVMKISSEGEFQIGRKMSESIIVSPLCVALHGEYTGLTFPPLSLLLSLPFVPFLSISRFYCFLVLLPFLYHIYFSVFPSLRFLRELFWSLVSIAVCTRG